MKQRCKWAGTDPVYIDYHDKEWGVPLHNDQKLFEFIILEGAQAGLSWLTILKRRPGFRQAFANFEVEKVARFTSAKIEELILNPAIIRNRAKINSAVSNAKAFIKIQEEFGSFDRYSWQFVDGQPIINHFKTHDEIPVKTRQSIAFSKDLVQRGFKFTGPVIIYAYMQAVGMVNDHLTSCFRYKELQNM